MIHTLKQQIWDRLKRCYPGFDNKFKDGKSLFSGIGESHLYNYFLINKLTAQEILKKSETELVRLFGYSISYRLGKVRMKQLKNRLAEMLFPEEDFAKAQLSLLAKDLCILKVFEEEFLDTEQEIIKLGQETHAKYIMGQIKGISDLFASMYVGIIGDISKYKSAKHIYSKSGLAPVIKQSGGSFFTSMGIKRAGNVALRSILFKMASSVVVNDPFFASYAQRIKKQKERHWKKNRIAVCRKLNNVLFALMRDRSEFKRIATGTSRREIGYKPVQIAEVL